MKLPKTYQPGEYELDIYALWEKSKAFAPKNRGGKNFSIVLPPPNANGDLHVGHSLMFALQDISIRYHRMKGDKTLWLPGADHAGFETQVVYEKQLAKEGKSRFDFKREELYDQIWEFVAKNRENYQSQFRRLGASVDWDSFTYTLDDKIIDRAYKTFQKMWDDGLVYRGERLVNYCTHHRTGFADIEVAYEDSTSPLYYMKYGPFMLATTRPETKFGDTAVAVHPDDERYKKYIGQTITVEGVNGTFEIEVIADEMVDREFGTGVVKITPAHDFNDWEVAQRHKLPAVRVINHDGTMNEKAGRFRGMTVMDARKAVAEALDEKGLLVKVDKHYKNRVGKCYKCGTVIEPMLMKQWFIDMQPLAKPAIKALKDKEIVFYPDTKRKQLIGYLEGLRDWNISRQIAWGIPIPAFQNVDDEDDWVFDTRVDQEIIEIDGKSYRRDPDVFDTWFSSSSWPYATLEYPDSDTYKDFYPNSLMETGGEILYPWVSRMIMLGLYVTGKVPFKNVYIHGYVLAEDGSKMSKSVGNVIDPMAVIDKYGSDALRMGLVAGRVPAVNRGFDHRKVEDARNFANKLWNVARFIEDKIGSSTPDANHQPKAVTVADGWIFNRLSDVNSELTKDLEAYRYAEAYDRLYHFVWDDLADWYIESSKVALNTEVLAYVLDCTLRLAHPFAPFVTETIWQTLGWQKGEIITAPWPEVNVKNSSHYEVFSEIQNIVTEIRTIAAMAGVTKPRLYYIDDELVKEQGSLLTALSGASELAQGGAGGLKLTQTKNQLWIDLDSGQVKHFLEQLDNQLAATNQLINQLEGRLGNKSYVQNAPKHLVNETKTHLEEAKQKLASQEAERARFKDL